MDVSEFLRINAQESSLQRLKQMSRSSGDGQDSPSSFGPDLVAGSGPVDVSSTRLPYSELPRPAPLSVALTAPAAKLISVPPGGDLLAKKNLMPYTIDSNKVLSSSSKKNKIKAKSKPPVLDRSVPNVDVLTEITQTELATEETEYKRNKECPNQFDATFSSSHKAASQEYNNINQENVECSPIMCRVNDLVKTLPKEAVITPLNLDLLNNPPSEIGQKVKVFMSAKPPGVPTSKHSSIKYTQLTRKTYKEPKFVPYEPYKGCSDPIFGSKENKKSIKKEFALTSQPDLPAIPHQEPTVHQDTDRRARAKLEMAVKDFESERAEWEQRLKDMTARCELMDQQLSKSKRQTVTLEDQLNVQAHVNGELKKLLVASVGEDVQGRVHCLTEDKARMATMIRRYSEKLDRDYEERERMSILCDVWKSKFLASSVLVEELGSWKAALLRWTAEAAESLSVLLEEHSLVRTHTTRAHRLVAQLVAAFDPLHSGSGVSPSLLQQAGDGVSVSLAVAEQAQALHQRLLGPLMLHPPAPHVAAEGDQHSYTPGEKMAMQVLERRDSCVGYPGYAGSARGPRVPAGHPLHTASNILPSHMTVNCCAHCNGDIQLV